MISSTFLHGVMLSLLLTMILANDVVVSVQSQDVESMLGVTATIVNSTSHIRMTLGAIEATMARVVDENDAYLQSAVLAQPTLNLLNDIVFDASAQKWQFTFETMDTSEFPGDVNKYKRLLYLSRSDSESLEGDTSNPCLDKETSNADCVNLLKSKYITAASANADSDVLHFDANLGISVVVQTRPGSLLQTLNVSIPHSTLRNMLAYKKDVSHPTDGMRIQWSFGFGMLFLNADTAQSNVVIFHKMTILEQNNDLLQISQSTSYSVAQHVSFWTSRAAIDPTIYIATVEFLLAPNQQIVSLDATLNDVSISEALCSDMQHKVLLLNDTQCLTKYKLCDIITYVSADSQVWATTVLPVPTSQVDVVSKTLNILLKTTDTSTTPHRNVVSTLNFASRQAPQESCADATIQVFDVKDYTEMKVFRGQSLEPVSASDVFVSDSQLVNISSAPSMIMSLILILVQPKQNTQSTLYFNTFASEKILLDQVYMSHSLNAITLDTSFDNHAHVTSEGRSTLQLDPELINRCPMETDPSFVFQPDTFTCVTTHDWELDYNNNMRPLSSPNRPFVFHIQDNVALNKEWLQNWVLGFSDESSRLADELITATLSLIPEHGNAYWVHPLYAWPDRSPIGLKDNTLLSVSWSVTSPTVRRRHLLSSDSVIFAKKNINQKNTAKKTTVRKKIPTIDRIFKTHIQNQPQRSDQINIKSFSTWHFNSKNKNAK